VVDKASRTELREREEPRPLQIRLTAAAVEGRRHVRHQRQAWKVVTRQEALGREVAVGVEITRKRARALLEQVELVDRLRVPALRRSFLLPRCGIVIHDPARGVPLLLSSSEEVAPTVERFFKATECSLRNVCGVGVCSRKPGCHLR
jgi:hypothetical protein